MAGSRQILFGCALLLSISATQAFADDRAVLHGRELAEVNCARCHAIGQTGDSPHESAPPFRTLSQRFPVDTIDEALIVGVRPEHEDMPRFEITPQQASDLAAYIQTIQPEAHGRRLVEANCSQCHAIGTEDESPHAEAPALRTLSQFYPIAALEEAFVEGIVTGHPDMPVFIAEPEQIADIIAYIESIQD